MSQHKQLQQLRTDLAARFPERLSVITGALCAMLAGEHVLLLGPPGTAKSALARALAQAIGGTYFERLLTRFSTPEELFGPVSLKALEQDRFERVVAGKLPEAHVAFLDEVFKSNSAILNSLLTLMNERVFHNDGAPLASPLVTLFGASNELPEGRELEALMDRFLLRFDVGYLLQPQNFRGVLLAPEPLPQPALTLVELRNAQAAVAKVKVTDATVEALLAIRDVCKAEGIVASDRRWKKSLRLVQAAALLEGEKETSAEDLSLLVDSLWREPKERPKVARLVGKLSDPAGAQACEILDAARETSEKTRALKSTDRKAFLAQATVALEQFGQQQTKLTNLGRASSKRSKQTIAAATAEIEAMHQELARTVSAGLGLRGRS